MILSLLHRGSPLEAAWMDILEIEHGVKSEQHYTWYI